MIGFLLGSAAGGAIALLFAPKPGKKLRKDISKATGEVIEGGRKMAIDTWNGVKDTAESTLESANDILNSGMEKIVRKTENIRDAFTAGMSTYAEERRSEKKGSESIDRDPETSGKIT